MTSSTDWTTEPPAGDASAIFTSAYAVNGGAKTLERTPSALSAGANSVTLDLTATSADGFPAGPYAAIVTITREATAGS